MLVASNTQGGTVNMIEAFANAEEDPYLYQKITSDNFYCRIGGNVAWADESNHSCQQAYMNYNPANGQLSFSSGASGARTAKTGNNVYGVPYINVYCIY